MYYNSQHDRRLFLANLPQLSREELTDYAKPFGKLADIDIIQSRGYCFIVGFFSFCPLTELKATKSGIIHFVQRNLKLTKTPRTSWIISTDASHGMECAFLSPLPFAHRGT